MTNESQRQLETSEIQENAQTAPQETEQVSSSEEERNYEAEAVELINGVIDNQEERAEERYGRGLFGKAQVSIFRESRWIKSDDLEETGEFIDLTKRAKAYKWGIIGLKAAGGLGAAAAMTFTGGLGAILTPSIWSIGLRKGIDAVLEAGEELIWGRRRTQKELEFQLQLAEEITNLKQYLVERKENENAVNQEEFTQMVERILDKDAEVARTQNENMTSERTGAIIRAVASSVLTIGAAIFGGVPLGTHDYDKATEYTYWGKATDGSTIKMTYSLDAKHRVLWNLKGGQFLYNQGEMDTVHSLQQLGGLNQVFTDFAGRAGHTLGGSLPWAERSALIGSCLYLFGTPLYQALKKKKDISQMTQRAEIEGAREGEEGVLYGAIERRRRRREEETRIMSKEETFDNTDYKFDREAAQITLAKIDKYERLNPESPEEREERFLEETMRLLKDNIVVHGDTTYDKKGNKIFKQKSDTDGETALQLFRLAGVDLGEVSYVEQGDYLPEKVMVDTGNRHGFVAEGKNEKYPFGRTFFMDHHGDESGEDVSATEIVYHYLISTGLLQKRENLDKLVEFVTHLDNLAGPFQVSTNYGLSHRSLLGLHSHIEIEKLFEFFEKGDDPTRELSKEEILALGGKELLKKSEGFAKKNMAQEKRLLKMKSDGYVVDSPYGEVLVDIGGKVDKYAFAASPYKTHIRWQPREKRLFISGLPREVSLRQGKRIRGMWLKPHEDKGPLRITLAEILQELEVEEGAIKGKLRGYLQREGRKRRGIRRIFGRARTRFASQAA